MYNLDEERLNHHSIDIEPDGPKWTSEQQVILGAVEKKCEFIINNS